MGPWSAADIAPRTGRTFGVTGANSGIGPAATRKLVRASARVVMAVRDTAKGDAAAATFLGLPGSAEVRALDLAELVSVHRFAAGVDGPVDVLTSCELQRRFVAAVSLLRSMAAHPGYSATDLQSRTETVQDQIMGLFNRVIAQGPEGGALPTLHAATEPDRPGGSYIGPDGLGEIAGAPRPVGSSAASHDRVVARMLWDRAVELTDVRPDVASSSA